MKRSGLTAALYLFLTFGTGVAVGVFSFWLYTSRSVRADSQQRAEDYRKRYLREMETRLKLDTEQMQKLATILDATRALFRQLGDKHRPEWEALQQHQVEQIRSILNEKQDAEYAKMRKEREDRKKKLSPGY